MSPRADLGAGGARQARRHGRPRRQREFLRLEHFVCKYPVAHLVEFSPSHASAVLDAHNLDAECVHVLAALSIVEDSNHIICWKFLALEEFVANEGALEVATPLEIVIPVHPAEQPAQPRGAQNVFDEARRIARHNSEPHLALLETREELGKLRVTYRATKHRARGVLRVVAEANLARREHLVKLEDGKELRANALGQARAWRAGQVSACTCRARGGHRDFEPAAATAYIHGSQSRRRPSAIAWRIQT
eukprot:CAMPEP_0119428178 /NCGR_PEP_ID=MMETSP1335-20130426/39937_1 /TAXON_ID=259385 /ORGANISM="Chrysoculter rhomboideus, Strain RCC1486" /LENGTH=247 /DNA_ID=CAMNT_0007453847 /DNA_START=86 /DNA_END=825 /DNA_ORIENTATION=+